MKNKYMFIKIAGLAGLLLIVVVYLLAYFMPSLESISKQRRELKDMNLRIQQFLQAEKDFDFPTDRELLYFTNADEELKSKIPEIKSREELFDLFTQVFDYIKTRARKDGIFNLVVNSTSSELELNATTLSTDKKTLERLLGFAALQLTEIRKQTPPRIQTTVAGPTPTAAAQPAPMLEDLNHQLVYLSFTGELKQALRFINRLPWSDYYLRPHNIMVSSGGETPFYMVFLKVYYVDKRPAGEARE